MGSDAKEDADSDDEMDDGVDDDDGMDANDDGDGRPSPPSSDSSRNSFFELAAERSDSISPLSSRSSPHAASRNSARSAGESSRASAKSDRARFQDSASMKRGSGMSSRGYGELDDTGAGPAAEGNVERGRGHQRNRRRSPGDTGNTNGMLGPQPL